MRIVRSPAWRTFRTCAFGFNPIGAQARHGCKALCVLLVFCLLVIAGCGREDTEIALRRQAQGAIEALAEHDHGAFMDIVADDFAGPEGMDRQGVSQMARLYFLRFRQIRLLAGPLSVEMADQRARVSFSLVLAGGDGLLPDQAQAYQVDSAWRLDGDDWLMIALEWRAATR